MSLIRIKAEAAGRSHTSQMEIAAEIAELRRRAQWYRDFADVGSADNKELRHALARHFDRCADELEARRKEEKG